MTAVETICLTIAVCWLSLMAVIAYYVASGRRVKITKSVEVEV
jgi:hypothetical protein